MARTRMTKAKTKRATRPAPKTVARIDPFREVEEQLVALVKLSAAEIREAPARQLEELSATLWDTGVSMVASELSNDEVSSEDLRQHHEKLFRREAKRLRRST